ncbi:hypothetical protein PCANC_10547 [Puccinia coronata f. sp. avenae]|uniref:Uncharacterized protein n=1 Tax=Puccinia coronata f. sp. avenae TaxID=200324 RepID=A0A2N5VZ57_9BASI|nr:hypothetical protein PCANC_10547 [Puccinia coronata f. sp. avenae]
MLASILQGKLSTLARQWDEIHIHNNITTKGGQHVQAITASNAGSDGCIQVYIGCNHPIQTRAPGHRVNQEPIQTRWPNPRATEFELVNNSLGGPAPKFESDDRI